jgi:hypothetical protein
VGINMKLIFAIFVMLLLGVHAGAQEVVESEKTIEVLPVPDMSNQERALLTATEQLTTEYVEKMIGADAVKNGQKLIDEKIVANSSKYILSQKSSKVPDKKGKLIYQVSTKISLKNLRQMLVSSGLLFGSGSLSANVRLVVVGAQKPLLVTKFKNQVSLQMREVKSIRERFVTSDETAFDLETTAAPEALAEALEKMKFDQLRVKVESFDELQVSIKVESM